VFDGLHHAHYPVAPPEPPPQIMYTDGSLDGLNTAQCRSSFAVTLGNDAHMHARLDDGEASSFRSELVAILAALCNAAEGSTLRVHTDSQSAIDGWQRNTQPASTRARVRTTCAREWAAIRNVLATRRVQLMLIKVAAHTGVAGNERADQLATQALALPPVSVRAAAAPDLPCMLHIRGDVVTGDPRRALRRQAASRRLVQLQQRVGTHIADWHAVDWQAVVHVIHYGTSPRSHVTSDAHNRVFSFGMKLLLGMLPVWQRNHAFWPERFPRATCPRCSNEDGVGPVEDQRHLWECPRAASGVETAERTRSYGMGIEGANGKELVVYDSRTRSSTVRTYS